MNRLMIVFLLDIATAPGDCINPPPKLNDPYYAPVLPHTPLPTAQNSGAVCQTGFEQNPCDDRRAFRVGDIITITLNEKTRASKKTNSNIQRNSRTKMGLTSLFGNGMTTNSPIDGGNLNLSAEYGNSCDAKSDSQTGQSDSLTGSITVTVAEVLPNGILSVRGEGWITLDADNELVRIAGLVRADDIATDNAVSLTRAADARITYSDTGVFADASQPDWLDHFFLNPL